MVLIGLVAVCLLALVGIVIVAVVQPGGGEVAGGYQNEDYSPPPVDTNPPPLPTPTNTTDAEAYTQRNKLYDQSVPNPTRCDVKDVDPTTASNDELEAWLNELTGCMMRVWDRTMQAANYQLPRPSVTVYTNEVNTKCGRAPGRNAFYCSLDQQLYFADDMLSVVPANLRNRTTVQMVLAHEFGHHIQGRSGIFGGMRVLAESAGSERNALVFVRRNEAQADCFAGMFLRSSTRALRFSQSDLDGFLNTAFAMGSDQLSGDPDIWSTHPHGATRQRWMRAGLGSDPAGACRTYTAPDGEVR